MGVVDIPVVAQRQIPMVQTVQKTIEIPQLQYIDKVVDVPVVQVVQVPQVQVVEKTVEIPQLQIVEKIVEIPEIQTVQGTQTSESLAPHLSARWHRRKLWRSWRSERLFPQNPHHPCSSRHQSWKLLPLPLWSTWRRHPRSRMHLLQPLPSLSTWLQHPPLLTLLQ